MKQLISISTQDLIIWFDEIVDAKTDEDTKGILLNIRDQISDRYNHYVNNFSEEGLIQILDSTFERNHPQLLSCYKSEGIILSTLKKAIRDLQDVKLKGTCQYCDVGKPKSIDHYLPISEYPEYSVLGINLIPCCKDCNEKKRSYWKENDSRGILNYYLDNIPQEQFLFANFHFVLNIPRVSFEILNPNNQIDIELFEIISRHFTRLKLIELYNDECGDELDEMIRNFRIYSPNKSAESLRNELLIDALELQQQFGINYWRAAMRIALANSGIFINYIVNNH